MADPVTIIAVVGGTVGAVGGGASVRRVYGLEGQERTEPL